MGGRSGVMNRLRVVELLRVTSVRFVPARNGARRTAVFSAQPMMMQSARSRGPIVVRRRGLCDKSKKEYNAPESESKDIAAKKAEDGQIQMSIIEQTTALDKGGVKLSISEDIMIQPTLGGKVYTATSYLTQFALAGGGILLFG